MSANPLTIPLIALAGWLFAAASTAQDPEPPVPTGPEPLVAARDALDGWLESDHADRAMLDSAIDKILDAGRAGIELVRDELLATKPTDRERRLGIDPLVTNLTLTALRRGVDSGMVFAGQYDDLRLLQPAVGRFMVQLVVDTPDWFPEDMRALVIPALRDVYPTGPGEDALERLIEIAKDEEFETGALREAVAYGLAQWGHREFVQGRILELTENAGAGRTTEELWFVRLLARTHYQLREYRLAADQWQRFLDGWRAAGAPANELDEYDAACCSALAGDLDQSLAAIERCADIVARGDQSTTAKITRQMFETDPDLRSVRALPRFRAAVVHAFGAEPGESVDRPDSATRKDQ